MSGLNILNMRRTLLIAQRDFFGYVRTWGFWLTTFGPFIGLAFLMMASVLMVKSEPMTYGVIFDETGKHASAIEQVIADQANFENMPQLGQIPTAGAENYGTLPITNLVILNLKNENLDSLKKKIAEDIDIPYGEKSVSLTGLLHIYQLDQSLKADYWTSSPQNNDLVNVSNKYFAGLSQEEYLGTGNLTMNGLSVATREALRVERFNPQKSATDSGGQKVTFEDGLPYFIAAGLSLLLWLTIFTGAYMLLVSMVEEKINKVLEMLLATTRFAEIFVGKLIGVAALTFASLLPWIIAGTIASFMFSSFGDVSLLGSLKGAIGTKMLIFLPIFLVLGYVFYGSIFIALGAMAESMQDASTLMTPMVLLMTVCMMVVPIGLNYPESPIVYFGQWFPFSAPFAAIVRLPSDPPLWETIFSVLSLILSSILVIWFSSRVFQHGVLSGGGTGAIKGWFMGKIRRQKPTK